MPLSPARSRSSRAARRPARGPDGVLLVDKPPGWTSHDVVERLRKVPGFHKTGHAGTLDPMATGLLIVCVNEATKIARFLMEGDKEYAATVRLGVVTDTLDATGRVLREGDWRGVTREDVERALGAFLGMIDQVPPMYSALKREGVPLYRLARRGIEVARTPRQIEITHLELMLRDRERIDFTVACSKGTYVRTLAADLGRALGTVAHLERLRRTRVGAFAVEEALPLAALETVAADALPLLRVREVLAGYAAFPAPAGVLARLRRGQQEPLSLLPPPRRADETALVLDLAGEVAGVIEAAGATWRLVRLFADS